MTLLSCCRGLMHDVPLGASGLPGWLKTPPQFCPGTMLLAPVCCISCCRAKGILTQDESSCHTLSSARVTNWLGPSLQTQHISNIVQICLQCSCSCCPHLCFQLHMYLHCPTNAVEHLQSCRSEELTKQVFAVYEAAHMVHNTADMHMQHTVLQIWENH